MKPVAIFRFSSDAGPGYFASFLDRRSIPWTLYKLDEGDALPLDLDHFSGFVFMGGAMSVNDDLPWIPPILALIREAIARLLGDQKQPRRFVSAYELAKDFCGIAKNTPRDIATNPKYLEGFGE